MSDNHDPLEEDEADVDPAWARRKGPLLIVVVAGALLALNHYEATNNGKVYLWIVLMAPLFFCLGVGGLIDPRLSLAMGPQGRHFPTKIKALGGLLVAVGMIASAYLALGVYRLQEPATSQPAVSQDLPGSSR